MAIIMSIKLLTPHEAALEIAKRCQAKRLSMNLTQQILAKRSGVSYGALKKFERTGEIAFVSLLKLALVLNALDEFTTLFPLPKPEEFLSLKESLNVKTRQRARS